MEFFDRFTHSRKGNESIWVIVCRLNKVTHSLTIQFKRNSRHLADMYVKVIIKVHGVP